MNIVRNLLAVSALALLPGMAFAAQDASAPTVDKSGVDQKVVDQKGDEKGKCESGGHKHKACTPMPTSPSIYGPTGVIITPNAEIVGGGQSNVAFAGGYDIVDNNIPNGDPFPNVNYYKANLGLFKHLEIGGTFTHINTVGTADQGFMNLKANLLKPGSFFQIAGGVIDALGTGLDFDGTDGLRTEYVVGQVTLGKCVGGFIGPFRASGGWMSNAPIAILPVVVDNDMFFANGSLMITKYLEAVGEWMNFRDANVNDVINVGGRLHFGGLEVHGYLLDVTKNLGVNDVIPVFGASYTFTGKAKKHHGGGGEEKGKGEEVLPKGKEEVVPLPSSSSNSVRTHLAANLLRAQ